MAAQDKFKDSLTKFRQHAESLDQNRRRIKRLDPEDAEVVVKGGKRIRVETIAKLEVVPMEVGTGDEAVGEGTIYTYPHGRGAIHLYAQDLERLNEKRFLNDQIINFVLKWMYDTTLSTPNKELAHVCDSHLYTEITRGVDVRKLEGSQEAMQGNLARVSKWFAKTKGIIKNLVLVPICEDSHWVLAVVINEAAPITRLLIMDSLPNILRSHIGQVLQRLIEYVAPGRTYSTMHVQVNRQANLYDCGVHLLHNACQFLKYVDTHPRCELAEVEASLPTTTMTREELRTLILQVKQPQTQQLQEQQALQAQNQLQEQQQLREQLQAQQHLQAQQQAQQKLQAQREQQAREQYVQQQQKLIRQEPMQLPSTIIHPGQQCALPMEVTLQNEGSDDWAMTEEVKTLLVHTANEARQTMHQCKTRRRIFMKETVWGKLRFEINRKNSRCRVTRV